jgi:hypothetical protein
MLREFCVTQCCFVVLGEPRTDKDCGRQFALKADTTARL